MSSTVTRSYELDTEDDPFRYGWRYVRVAEPDGAVGLVQVPLTLEDVLHPQEEDFLIESDFHFRECAYLSSLFAARLHEPPLVLVTADMRIDWGVPGVGCHGPDVAVFVGLDTLPSTPRRQRKTLKLQECGGRCLLVIEGVSPSTRVNDVEHKLREYYEVGVPLYVIIDQEREGAPRAIRAYRPGRDGYEVHPLDGQGRLLLEPLGLYLTLGEEDAVVCIDKDTGKRYLDCDRTFEELDKADQRLEETEQGLEAAYLARRRAQATARLARKQAREEAQAREAAEKEARRQERARKKAEKARQEAEKGQLEAQARLQEEAAARLAAEQRLRELEEQIRRLQGSTK